MADVAAMDIVIGADVQKAIAGLEHLSDELMQMSKTGVTSIEQLNRAMATIRESAAKATDIGQLAKFNTALEKLSGEAIRLKNIKLGDSLKNIKPGADQATNALMNMGRVVQDAPYGFIGIANNINPLLESFQRLKAETGTTGGAIKALVGSLAGGAGLGIAVSVATSLIVAFGDKLSFSSKEVEEAKKANEELAKSLESIDKSATQSSQKEIASMQVLVRVAQNGSKAMSLRLDAVKELQKEFPDYFGNLSKEKILYGDLTPVINQTTEALMKQAMAQAATAKAGEIGAQLLDVSQKRLTAQAALNAAQAKYNEAIKDKGIGQGIVGFITSVENAKKAYNALNDQYLELQLQQATFLGQAENLTTTIKTTTTATGGQTKEIKKLKEELKNTLPTLEEYLKLSRQIYDLTKTAVITPTIDLSVKPITQDKLNKAVPTGVSIDVPLNITLTQKQIDDLKKKIKLDELVGDFEEKATKILQDTISGMFETIGEAIGEGKNPFAAMFKVLSDGIKQMGKALIEFGVQAGIIQKVLHAGILSTPAGPFIAIAAGIALEALGAALQAHTKMQHGGIVTGPTRALIGEAGPEVVFPLDRLREFIQPAQAQVVVLETRVRGSDIWLSQSRTNERRGRTY
jgi:uncharacterized protein with ATP-grasp and redox domains